MSDVTDRVREAVEEDIFLLVPLARGIVNHAALARWLQKHEGVLSLLSHYRPNRWEEDPCSLPC